MFTHFLVILIVYHFSMSSGESLTTISMASHPKSLNVERNLGVISDRKFILLDETGVISMQDCIAASPTPEMHQCDWLIHIENGSSVAASIYIDIPNQPVEHNCAHCYLEYGYVNIHKQRVLTRRTCQQHHNTTYHVKASLWLKFSCLGLKAHHHLNWTSGEGRQLQGFTLQFSVSKEQTNVKESGWDLSSIFALTVFVLSAVVLLSVGFILQRSCKKQSIQRNLLESRHESVHGDNSRMRKLLRGHYSRHRHGLHEQFLTKEMMTRRAAERIVFPGEIAMLSSDDVFVDSTHEDIQMSPVLKRSSRTFQRELTHFRRDKSPTRSNHTYVSITHCNPSNQESETESEKTTDIENGEGLIGEKTAVLSQQFLRACNGPPCVESESTKRNSTQSHDRKPSNKGANQALSEAEANKSHTRIANISSEPQLDETRQKKLLTAPRYTSPDIGKIPHIILTRASTKRKSTTPDMECDIDGQNNIISASITSLPEISGQKIQQNANYNSVDCMLGVNEETRKSRHHSKKIILTPKTLSRDFNREDDSQQSQA